MPVGTEPGGNGTAGGGGRSTTRPDDRSDGGGADPGVAAAPEGAVAKPRRPLSARVVAKRLTWAAAFWLTMRQLCVVQGYFEAAHYRQQVAAQARSRASRIFGRLWPFAHYLLIGYRQGLAPASRYDHDRAVASFPFYNEVLSSPLEVYVLFGRLTGGEFFAPDPAPAHAPSLPAPCQDMVVVVHAYHLPEFDLILDRLAALSQAVDLIVTTSHPEASIRERCRARGLAPVLVHHGPNRGRDVAPFCRLLNAGLLDRYKLIGKLHTKRSAHRPDGGDWFRAMIDNLVDPARLPLLRAALTGPGRTGLVAAPGRIGADPAQTADHRHMLALCARSGVATDALGAYTFPHGTMFWARAAALRPLADLALPTDAFEAEAGQLDGTLAHAIERMIGVYCAHEGYSITDMTRLPASA